MKGKIISSVLVIFLAIMMLIPLSTLSVFAKEPDNIDTTIRDRIDNIIINQQRTPSEQAEYNALKWQFQLESDISYVSNYVKEQEKLAEKNKSTKAKKEVLDKTKKALDDIKAKIPEIVAIARDAKNGGDFDTAKCLDSVVSYVSTIISYFGPYAQIASAAIDIGNAIFKLAMGGEEATSQMAQVEDRLTQQLDDIQNQIAEVEEQINNLSNEINATTNTIISEITTAIDNADAKAYLRTFMLSGEGTFSYDQYRNYIYGEIENNPKSNTAYYAWLKKSLSDGSSDETLKYYYDKLYSAIISNMDFYYDYIIGSENTKSIVQYYYDVVSARPDFKSKNGLSARDSAIMFAYDIYQTELMASHIILSCNLYQYTYMLQNGTLVDVTDKNGNVIDKEFVPLELYYYDNNNAINFEQVDGGMWEQLNTRINNIHSQLAKDLTYILKLSDSYIVEAANGELYEIVNNNPATYGNVLSGQTVYLNNVPDEICKLFDFEKNDFAYRISSSPYTDGKMYINTGLSNIIASLYYKDTELSTISLKVGASANGFNGGSGTADDPYLIASAEQFSLIAKGLDKHYRLIDDIDFGNATISPLGQRINSNNTVVYDEFTGSLDGNGYKISNLKVTGYTNSGIFGIIGEGGEVADITLYNVKVSADVKNADKSNSEFYAGMIAGKNNGIIKYCTIDSDGTVVDGVLSYGLFFQLINKTKNRCIDVYAGGIAGENNNIIVACSIANNHISASSAHDFGGDATETNKNNVYVGGICGYNKCGAIAHSIVKSSTKISSYAMSTYNPKTTVNPYVISYAGGIAAKVDSLYNICKVKSNAAVILSDAVLDCESKWGKHYANCFKKQSAYVPDFSEDALNAIIATEDVENIISGSDKNYTVRVDCPDTVYETGTKDFNAENLKLFIDGTEKKYEIIEIYGFNAQNKSFNNIPQIVTILFKVEIDGKSIYLAEEISITIKENYVTSAEILNLKGYYVTDTFCPDGLIIKYNYAVGDPTSVTLDSDTEFFGNITSFGEQSIAIFYSGEKVTFTINVVCGHGSNFTSEESGYRFDEKLSLEPSCSEIGYNAYRCQTCGDVKKFYIRKIEHTPGEPVGRVEPTCMSEGNTGKICCTKCFTKLEDGTLAPTVLVDGNIIPKLKHSYKYVDDSKHACTNEDGEFLFDENGQYLHSEYHHYTVTESVQLLDPDKNGTKEWYVVYTYTCVCKKDNGKLYSKVCEDENTITEETKALPAIVVSNGYVVNGGDEVSVYIQLVNNTGIKSAIFGIRYDVGLELIGEPQTGDLFKNLEVAWSEAIDYGYNFVFADANVVSENGNVVKLTFKVNDEAKVGDIFNISVVYNEMGKTIEGDKIEGGFSDGTKVNVVTRDGFIKIVGKGNLPGDVNKDNVVDLLDAVILAKSYANSEKYPLSTKDGDLNLDREITPDDIVALLEYLVGGYGTNLMTQDFEIVLNTNGFDDVVLENLYVSIYDENNTYDKAGLAETISQLEERTGYKFLGWYDRMYGGNLIFGEEKLEGIKVNYDKDQKKQTLYAHWELNKLIFNVTDATSGKIADIIYTDNASEIQVPSEPTRTYDVVFISKEYDKNEPKALEYKFLYFMGSNGKAYETVEEAIDALLSGHFGNLTLTAVWDTENPTIEYPTWTKVGYENNIVWYGDIDLSLTRRIEKNNEIIVKATKDSGDYKLYAKHTTIDFIIIYDGNGATGGNTKDPDATIRNTKTHVSLARNEYERIGYRFGGWKLQPDGKVKDYDDRESIGFIDNVQDGAVTLYAHWVPNTYTIEFNINSSFLHKESYNGIESGTTSSMDCEYDASYVLNENGFWLPGFIFKGWATSEKGQAMYVDLSKDKAINLTTEHDGKVTLYAVWEVDPYTIGQYVRNGSYVENTTKTKQYLVYNDYCNDWTLDLVDARVIIDWRGKSSENRFRITTGRDVEEVFFLGDKNKTYTNIKNIIPHFVPSWRHQTWKFVDFSFNVSSNNHLYECEKFTLEIYTEGTCNIGTTENGVTVFDMPGANLVLSGSGPLSITAGKGADASYDGGHGSNGGAAIIADNITVNMTGSLTITGGDGGNGAKGAYGGDGYAGGKKDVPFTGNGQTGGNGGRGGDGGNGGNGGAAILTNSLNYISGKITLKGGNGGRGGDGGNGGIGGQGGKNSGMLGSGGDGGRGGDGGDGGYGGAAGAVSYGTITGNYNGNIVILTANVGDRGKGGYGGDGGAGGYGVDNSDTFRGNWGSNGTPGSPYPN